MPESSRVGGDIWCAWYRPSCWCEIFEIPPCVRAWLKNFHTCPVATRHMLPTFPRRLPRQGPLLSFARGTRSFTETGLHSKKSVVKHWPPAQTAGQESVIICSDTQERARKSSMSSFSEGPSTELLADTFWDTFQRVPIEQHRHF